jgi:N6-adenosine-specific RNA methylase IME4
MGEPYLELFGRKSIRGWTAWGNEVSRFPPAVDDGVQHAGHAAISDRSPII